MRLITGRSLGDYTGQSADVSFEPAGTVARVAGLGEGSETAETLRHMRSFARSSVTHPEQIVLEQIGRILHEADTPARNWRAQVQACQAWVRDNIKYVKDPADWERVQTPEKTLQFGIGDCDDQATLLAAMMLCIDHPCRFAALAFDSGMFEHVLLETKIGDRWTPCETILPGVPLGWWPSGVTRAYRLNL
jgi:transglutaminase-like putative cysteine protease